VTFAEKYEPWPLATSAVIDATADHEIGILVYCAGADPDFVPFLANPIETAETCQRDWARRYRRTEYPTRTIKPAPNGNHTPQ